MDLDVDFALDLVADFAVVLLADDEFWLSISFFASSNVREAAAECMELLNSFGMTDTQEEYISGYTESMKNADTVLKKAYYAETMLTYAVSSTNLENSNQLTESYNSGNAVQSKNHIVTALNSLAQELREAIYSYTYYDEQ